MSQIASRSTQFTPAPPAPSAAPAASKQLTVRDAATKAPVSGVAVAIDNATPLTSDISGRVDLSRIAAGMHAFRLSAAGRALSFSAVVGTSFNQTVYLPAAAGTVASAAPAPAPGAAAIAGDMPDGSVGMLVSAGYAASGLTPPVTWDIASGALPDGMGDLTSTGDLTAVSTGSYTAAGDYDFTVRATDANGNVATLDDTVHVDVAMSWVDITSDTYWTSTGYSWTGTEWDMNAAPNCSIVSGLHPTAAGLTAMTGATKIRCTLMSVEQLDGTGPNTFTHNSNKLGVNGGENLGDITLTAAAAGTTFTDVIFDPFTPLASTGDSLQATSRCAGNYATDNFQFLKIEVFVP